MEDFIKKFSLSAYRINLKQKRKDYFTRVYMHMYTVNKHINPQRSKFSYQAQAFLT